MKALLLLLFFSLAQAALPPAPKLDAKGYLLIDYHSGETLVEHHADQRLEPASLTKIMTAYTVFKELQAGNIHLDDQVLVSKKAWQTGGSRMFIEVGKTVSVDDLIHGMIIDSGNDACVALAEHIAGTEEAFVLLMNKHARELGMNNTHFVNSTGLPDPDHYSSPRDILKVARALIKEFPQFYPLYSIKSFTYNHITQKNRNRLLWQDPSVDGVKTGHTQSAGYCLVASAKRDHMRLLSVVMGTKSPSARTKASQTLLNYGFRFYQTHRLFGQGQVIKTIRIWKGDRNTLELGLKNDLYVTIPRNTYQQLKLRVQLPKSILAPVQKDQVIGQLKIEYKDQLLRTVPLIALQTVNKGGFFHNLVDSIWMMIAD